MRAARLLAMSLFLAPLLVPVVGADEHQMCQPMTEPATQVDEFYFLSRKQGSATVFYVWRESNDFQGLQTSKVYCGEAPEQPSDTMVTRICTGACGLPA